MQSLGKERRERRIDVMLAAGTVFVFLLAYLFWMIDHSEEQLAKVIKYSQSQEYRDALKARKAYLDSLPFKSAGDQYWKN